MNQKSPKSLTVSDKLDVLYKELFVAQFIEPNPLREYSLTQAIRRLEENEGTMEAYRESVRADGASL